MKTLKNHTLLYDKDCPLCSLYTGAFIKTGMLDENGRCAYGQNGSFMQAIDAHKAKNEIALVNTQTNTALYGIDSLIHVCTHNKPVCARILHFAPLYYALKFLYAFISYNRKLIAPAPGMYAQNACVPSFNWFYRILYFAFAALITSVTLSNFIRPVLLHFHLHTNNVTELAVVSGQLIFQGTVVFFIKRERMMDYLGNMMTVSLVGALLLIPPIILQQFMVLSVWFYTTWFAAVIFTMFLLHMKRCKLLGLDLRVTASWILYRVLVLSVIL